MAVTCTFKSEVSFARILNLNPATRSCSLDRVCRDCPYSNDNDNLCFGIVLARFVQVSSSEGMQQGDVDEDKGNADSQEGEQSWLYAAPEKPVDGFCFACSVLQNNACLLAFEIDSQAVDSATRLATRFSVLLAGHHDRCRQNITMMHHWSGPTPASVGFKYAIAWAKHSSEKSPICTFMGLVTKVAMHASRLYARRSS